MENEQNQAVITIAQDLQEKLLAIKALVTAHSLLGVGMFQHRHQQALSESLKFLEALHLQVMEEALVHPDADKCQELVEYQIQRNQSNAQKEQE